MSKKNVAISIDEFIHKNAKKLGINISDVCENALKIKTSPTKKDIEEKSIKLMCWRCGGIFDEGYICEFNHKFTCEKCEKA